MKQLLFFLYGLALWLPVASRATEWWDIGMAASLCLGAYCGYQRGLTGAPGTTVGAALLARVSWAPAQSRTKHDLVEAIRSLNAWARHSGLSHDVGSIAWPLIACMADGYLAGATFRSVQDMGRSEMRRWKGKRLYDVPHDPTGFSTK